MGRKRIINEKKAISTPISLKPEDKYMLEILQRLFDKSRSSTIQLLIKREYDYFQRTGKIREDHE